MEREVNKISGVLIMRSDLEIIRILSFFVEKYSKQITSVKRVRGNHSEVSFGTNMIYISILLEK